MCTIFATTDQTITQKQIELALMPTTSRGPDAMRIEQTDHGWIAFQRLAIMGLHPEGMQPFSLNRSKIVCNGEIYGFKPLKEKLIQLGYTFRSESDCEILLPLYQEYGCKMFSMLDAEYALVLYDGKSNKLIAARDPIGIRPLYYGYTHNGSIVFASEPKNLVALCEKILPFPPGHYYKDGEFICYKDVSQVDSYLDDDLETIAKNIHDKLIAGVEKRLDSDTPIGYLLSGGLDSSLVCAIAQSKSSKPIETYAIGMDQDAIDLKYAKEVAEYIRSNHHEIIIDEHDVLSSLEEVIQALGTYDITTIRASIGMYLICKKIHEMSDVRVLSLIHI